ncbi:hypothetical protein HYPSUDRAFT_1032758 [Hypholoma sublateritium FD-334 SS-4]|uniref:Uncharacterized protein n=1 Tax=Hypholoma sublateritium (strain FD-334 SS-4) TaxID=945553 RepID=A0A0D2P7A6_HYPSF|nr:hypothetical protein HYPSUDRAFT_1032758 [Hypholoma sublateritium FD-334 SS-4]
MPIGNRRDSAPVSDRPASYPPNSAYFPRPPPQASGFNPNARPPPSALIRPAATSEFKHGQESYTRSSKPPAAEEPRRNPPPVSTQYAGPQPAANQSAAVSAEGTGPKRRVSRFSPLVSQKPDSNQEHATQLVSRSLPEGLHQRERAATPPPVSRDPSILSEQKSTRYSDPLRPSEGPQSVERAKIEMRARAAWRAERSAQSRPTDTAADAAAADRVGSSQTASTLSTESASSQRPRYKWSEQMANAAAPVSPEAAVGEPDLSLRLSSEKPPRHRKYSAPRFAADDSMPVDAPPSDEPENTVNFLDRLDAPILSRRSSKLLDRLSVAQDSATVSAEVPETPTPSLRDRLVPSKRSVDDMMDIETGSYEGDDNENKRLKRRTSKAKRGGRR